MSHWCTEKKLENKASKVTGTNGDTGIAPEVLDPAYAEKRRKATDECSPGEEVTAAARQAWMDNLRMGDYSGPVLDASRYLSMRNRPIEGNRRQTEEYRQKCCDAVGIGAEPDKDRYKHLTRAQDFDVLRWVVRRSSGCMWLPDSPRTTVK